MKTFLLKITTHNGDAFSDNVISLSVRGTEGDLAVMAGHTPFITYLQAGECKIVLEDGNEKLALIQGGTLVVSSEKTILLTGELDWQ
ncbi:MAG: F0F1 ATP synthase subunit epsilon [Clostridia bacterium]|nr:F0F1 ATP synthase subunit epsilon [Clostridia bacterium]